MSAHSTGDDTVRLDDTSGTGCSWRFSGRVTTITAYNHHEVAASLTQVEELVQTGLFAVGFVAYEAASALNQSLQTAQAAPDFPLVWFSLYTHRHAVTASSPPSDEDRTMLALNHTITEDDYLQAVETIRQRIAQGDCYQANYTYHCHAHNVPDPTAVYHQIIHSQKAPFCALIDTGRFVIMSASPELFFKRTGDTITTRPMKGTTARGYSRHDDHLRIQQLALDPKERAENLMIVDLLRNDLGVISEVGSVRTDSLFNVETYPTLHQMTSSISATLKNDTSLLDIFTALFPCGSVTGAPKRKTMEILTSLENKPRGVYCGAIGMVAPGNEAVFSVPIRTLVYDHTTASITSGVGSGITWDSNPHHEFEECRTKTLFTATNPFHTGLIESLRCEQGRCLRIIPHIERMTWSAQRIGIPFDPMAAEALLTEHASGLCGVHKVRLLLDRNGSLSVTSLPIPEHNALVRIALSLNLVDPADPRYYHKLSDRSRYDQIRREHPEADEVIMGNIKGELTEGTYTNLVLKCNGRLLTPPVSSGLLPGVMRGILLADAVIHEQVLYPSDLTAAEEVWVINSVRGWQQGVLCQD